MARLLMLVAGGDSFYDNKKMQIIRPNPDP